MRDRSGRLARLQAYDFIKGLERPSSLTLRQWSRVVQLLYIIARSYPRAYKGQRRMADEMKVSERSVRYYVQWAQDAGLLAVTSNAGMKHRGAIRRTNLYHLVYDTETASLKQAGLASKEQGIPRYPLRTTKGPTDLTTSGPSNRAGQAGTHRVRRIPGVKSGEALNAANERGYVTRREPKPDPDVSRRLTAYFAEKWQDAVVLNAHLAAVRSIETQKVMTGYVRHTFISPKTGRRYSEVEVQAFIDEFVQAAVRGLKISVGQSAWQRFVGWWGRRPAAPAADSQGYFQKRLTPPAEPT